MTTNLSTIDLHVHSKYSGTADDWYLNLLQASESYSEIEEIYSKARLKGRQFVTITDHDQIGGVMRLKGKYPEFVLTGVESTIHFPEDQCKVHILVYGFSESNFYMMQKLRKDIYQFRDYLKETNLAHSIAHPLLAMDRNFSIAHLEKLVLLFDVFETRNGSQSATLNNTWFEYISSLTPERIGDFYHRHRIKPMSDTPWQKGYTGGSDDHGGLYIGQTYTIAQACTPDEFLNSLRQKKTTANGDHGTYQEMTNSILKVTYETLRRRYNGKLNNPLVRSIATHLFEGKSLSWFCQVQIKIIKTFLKLSNRPTHKILYTALTHLTTNDTQASENNGLFNRLVHLSDELLQVWVDQIHESKKLSASPSAWKNKFMATVAGLLVSMPYFAGLGLIQQNHSLLDEVTAVVHNQHPGDCKKTLWFSDDPSEAITINLFCAASVQLVQCHRNEGHLCDLTIYLPPASSFRILAEKPIEILIPSPLRTLEILAQQHPDQIIISTTGPVGILGFIYARLMRIPVIGFIQPEFHERWYSSLQDEEIKHWFQQFHNWFIALLDHVIEPQRTGQYVLPEYLLGENQPVDMEFG